MTLKKDLRLKKKALLRDISPKLKIEKSKNASERLLKLLNRLGDEKNILLGLYDPITEDEIDWRMCEDLKKFETCFPDWQESDRRLMEFKKCRYENLKMTKVFGRSLKKPSKQAQVMKPSVLVIPAIAFDRLGFRLGRGKGYYDRYLAENKTLIKVGLCFSEGLVEELPSESHDQSVDFLITDCETLKFNVQS